MRFRTDPLFQNCRFRTDPWFRNAFLSRPIVQTCHFRTTPQHMWCSPRACEHLLVHVLAYACLSVCLQVCLHAPLTKVDSSNIQYFIVTSVAVCLPSGLHLCGWVAAPACMEPPPRSGASGPEDPLDAILTGIKLATPPEQYKRRGSLLTAHMRCIKAHRRRARGPVIAEHIKLRISNFHRDYAIRACEKICLEETKPVPEKGKGVFRRWLPEAVLRACWGLRVKQRLVARATRRPLRAKTGQRPRMASPSVASARNFARFYRANHSHVAAVRCATAQQFLDVQKVQLTRPDQPYECLVVELAIDETEMKIKLESEGTTVHIMVLHGRLSFRSGDTWVTRELVMAPAVVESTSAEVLVEAIKRRLPRSLAELATWCRPGRSFVLLNSDSAASCLRAARRLNAVAAVCRMPQLVLAIVSVVRLGGMMSATFCATLLIRRRRIQRILRTHLRTWIRQHLTVTFTPPTAAERQHLDSILLLLEPLLKDRLLNKDDETATKRLRSLHRLRSLLAGSVRSSHVCHYCPFGCHQNKAQIEDDIYQCMLDLFIHSPPPTPAWNKWTKTFPAIIYFGVLLNLSGMFAGALQQTPAPHRERFDEMDGAEGCIIQLDDATTHQFQEYTRFKKARTFLLGPKTADKTLAVTVSFGHVLKVMGDFFSSARRYGDTGGCCFLSLVNARDSPVWTSASSKKCCSTDVIVKYSFIR